VPRTLPARHKLDERAVPTDEEMSGDPEPGYAGVIRVRSGVQPVGEKLDDSRPTKFAGRQADCVDDEEIDRAACGVSMQLGESM
jgi:hypothetical protein